MNQRWVEIDHHTSARTGAHTVVAVLHVEDEQGEFGFGCGHLHRSERTAVACAETTWPGVRHA